MSQHDTTTKETALGDHINGYKNLYPRQRGEHTWDVLSFRSGETKVYRIDLSEMTCPCDDMHYNKEDNEVCDHVATVLYESDKKRRLEETLVHDLATEFSNIEQATQALEDAADTAEGLLVNARDGQAEQATQDDSDDSQDDTDDGGENYTVLQPDDSQAGMCKAIRDWISSAQQFNSDIDPEIIQTKWIEIEGKEGVWVDRAPFHNDATYYDDGEWQDKDGFDAASEAVGDLLSNRNEFEWFGEPDYVWFVPEGKVSEVTG
jgi:hypothetical protein